MTTIAQTATLAHGYTMADIDRIAAVAVRKDWYSKGLMTHDERIECAWDAVVATLYAAEEWPPFFQLLTAGVRALSSEAVATRKFYGMTKEGLAPRHIAYWLPIHRTPTDGFSDHLVEKMALREVLGVLTDLQYEAIATLAAFDNRADLAADSLGVKRSTFQMRVHDARKRINAVWYDGETPPKGRAAHGADKCRAGHSRAEYGVQRQGKWTCRACNRTARRRKAAKHGWPGTKAHQQTMAATEPAQSSP